MIHATRNPQPATHPSERELGSPAQPASALIASGQRCYCFSSSKSSTSTESKNQGVAAQDNAVATSGENNVVTSGLAQNLAGSNNTAATGGSTIAGGDVTAANAYHIGDVGEGSTVTITTDAPQLSSQFADAVKDITQNAGELLGQTIQRQSDLAQKELATFTNATEAVKTGFSQQTITVLTLAAVGLAGFYLFRRNK